MKQFRSYLAELAWKQSTSKMVFGWNSFDYVMLPLSPTIIGRIMEQTRDTVFHTLGYRDIKNLKANSAVFDLIYNPIETKLIKEAKKRGIINTNGLDMLIYQAQRSFYYWFNRTPKITNKLKKILEKEIK